MTTTNSDTPTAATVDVSRSERTDHMVAQPCSECNGCMDEYCEARADEIRARIPNRPSRDDVEDMIADNLLEMQALGLGAYEEGRYP